ncbi:MAG TPA: peptidylprolyl isomerase [Burkholderiales bacterium]|nr:peptidylprolyl isomerase [Burkholderiales bacterium]
MKFKTLILMLAAVFGSAIYSACDAQETPKAAFQKPSVVATVNGTPIPQSQFDILLQEHLARGEKDSEELRKQLREDLITRELLYQELTKNGFDKNPSISAQADFVRENFLLQAYLQDYLKTHPVSDDVLKAEYDKIKSSLDNKQEYHARHILVDKEADAKDIIAQLKKGAKFDKLASEKSKDTGSASKGGDLGWILTSNVVKPFGDALLKLKKGQYTQTPVETQFGWHVIKLEDTRPVKVPQFEDVKPKVQQAYQQQQFDKYLADLRAKAKIE